jgi:hypothetical protein
MSSPAPTFDKANVPPMDERRESLTQFLESKTDGTFYVGHASFLTRLGGKKFLFDPVLQRPLLLDSWLYFPPQVMDARLLDVDAVLISHFHEDHYDPRLISQLRPGTPVYIVEQRPMFEGWLRELGANVQVLPARKLTEIEKGVHVYAMPSEYNAIDSSFLLKNDNLCVYQGNDNFLTDKTLVEARRVVGKVDHAFVPYAYIWWYPFCLGSIDKDVRYREGQRMVSKYLDLGLEHARILDAPVVVPCGGNLVYYDRVDSVINEAVYTPYDFADYAREHAPDLASRVSPMVGGDYILKERGENKLMWRPSTTEAYQNQLAHFLADWAKNNPEVVSAPKPFTAADVAFLERRLANPLVPALNYDLVFQRSDAPQIGFRVDLTAKKIHFDTVVREPKPWIRFELQSVAMTAWMTERIIFEVVLESARFVVYRFPEQHDPKIWEALRLYF